MPRTTLRLYLQAHRDSQFIHQGKVVTSQCLVDHYSSYLDAQVAVEGTWVFFVTSRGHEQVPFACRVPIRLELPVAA